MSKKRLVSSFTFLLVLLSACSEQESAIPQLTLVAEYKQGLEFPTQLILSNGVAWVAQLHATALLVFEDFPNMESKRELASDSAIESPHFMVANEHGVYVSEGRGAEVSFFPHDLNRPGKALALELNIPMHRPHGVCIDNDNWLYIADSVNSRLIRTNLDRAVTEVFADVDKKIAYGRQLLCRDDGVWIANSYEKAFKLNQGNGGNVLRISDFSSGRLDTVVSFPHNNTTGIEIINDRLLLIGRWSGARDIVMFDLLEQQLIGTLFTSTPELDAPYGMYLDTKNRYLYVAFLGLSPDRPEGTAGGILQWRY
jgi:hypothetical protein